MAKIRRLSPACGGVPERGQRGKFGAERTLASAGYRLLMQFTSPKGGESVARRFDHRLQGVLEVGECGQTAVMLGTHDA